MNDSRTRLALLPLRTPLLPDASALASAFAALFPDLSRLKPELGDNERVVLRAPGALFSMSLVREPIAWDTLSYACDAAWYWPDAKGTLRPHTAHLRIVAESTDQNAIALMLSLTRVVAAALEASDALGVYLPGAQQVHRRDDFVSEAKGASAELLPLYLWVRFSLSQEDDGSTTLTTTGLAELEQMEVEFPRARIEPQTLMDRAFNIAHYLLDHGPVLAHGHTIGISNDERFMVRHVPSLRGDGSTVLQLRMV
ncbi:MAG: hypothetical protein RL385_2849 [Pseudomonadota bacterium]